MEQLQNGFTLELCAGAFPLSTDSVVLADFTKLPRNARVLDLGSGCGTLGLMLCAKDPGCCVTGIELDENAHRTALENSRRNGVSARLGSICADLAAISTVVPSGSFDCCISNPPYFTGGPESKHAALARKEASCTLDALFRAAAWSLRYGGDFFLVHRPERLAELCAQAASNNLEPKRLCLLRHKEGSNVSLVLLQCRKGAKPGLSWEELCLHDAQGDPTAEYKRIYHL